MATHELKTVPPYFQEVLDGKKPFEIRKNDRDFKVGDTLRLREYRPVDSLSVETGYTGRELDAEVTYVLQSEVFGLKDGYCVLGIKRPLFVPEGGGHYHSDFEGMAMAISPAMKEDLQSDSDDDRPMAFGGGGHQ